MSLPDFTAWLVKNGTKTPFSEPIGDIDFSGSTSIVQIYDETARKYFVPDSAFDDSTILTSSGPDFNQVVRRLRVEVINSLVIETILRTATLHHPDLVATTDEFTLVDHFLRIEEIFFSQEGDKVQLGYTTNRLYDVVSTKFVLQDLKKIFRSLVNLGDKQSAWIIHGDIKQENIKTGGAGRTVIFDYGMSMIQVDFENEPPLILYSNYREMLPKNCMHIDSMFLAYDMELPSMENCSDPYTEAYKPHDGFFYVEKYLP